MTDRNFELVFERLHFTDTYGHNFERDKTIAASKVICFSLLFIEIRSRYFCTVLYFCRFHRHSNMVEQKNLYSREVLNFTPWMFSLLPTTLRDLGLYYHSDRSCSHMACWLRVKYEPLDRSIRAVFKQKTMENKLIVFLTWLGFS